MSAPVAGGARRGADEPPAEAYARTDLTFDVEGAACAAWLYRPDRRETTRLVVTAPGLLPDRRTVAPVARRYAAAGHPVLLFAPRGAVGSDGEANLLSPARQTADWAAALDLAGRLDDVDGSRPVLRGRGLAGLLALSTATERRVAGVVARAPLVSGLSLRRHGPTALAKLLLAAGRDALPALSATVPAATADPGEPSLYGGVGPPALDRHLPEGAGARTRVPARSALALRSPDIPDFGAVRSPALLTAAGDGGLVDPGAVSAAADTLPEGTFFRHPGDDVSVLGRPDADPALPHEFTFLAGLD
ncbi:MAG: alpha/beta hydrolase [Haloferacaceae archaeon]